MIMMKLSLEIVDEISEYIAMGIGNVLNVIDSEVVVMGGGSSSRRHFIW